MKMRGDGRKKRRLVGRDQRGGLMMAFRGGVKGAVVLIEEIQYPYRGRKRKKMEDVVPIQRRARRWKGCPTVC
jgi:hypothetical protein